MASTWPGRWPGEIRWGWPGGAAQRRASTSGSRGAGSGDAGCDAGVAGFLLESDEAVVVDPLAALGARDAFLADVDAPREGASSADALLPAVVGKGDGAGDEEQSLVHRGNLPAVRGDVGTYADPVKPAPIGRSRPSTKGRGPVQEASTCPRSS